MPDFAALAHAITLAAGRAANGSTPISGVADRLALDLAKCWPEPSTRCVHCGEALENLSGDPSRPPHWVHISTDPRAPIGSAQCVGDSWGEIARPVDEHLCAECSSPTYVAGTHSMPGPDATTHRHDLGASGVWEHTHASGAIPHLVGPQHIEGATRVPLQKVDAPSQHLTWAANLLGQMSRQNLDSGQHYAIEEALAHLRRAAEMIETPPAERVTFAGPVARAWPEREAGEPEPSEAWTEGYSCGYHDTELPLPPFSDDAAADRVAELAEWARGFLTGAFNLEVAQKRARTMTAAACSHLGGFRAADGRWECSRCGHLFASYEAWGAETGNQAAVTAVRAAIEREIAEMAR